ncbi:MAG: phosphoribosylamine--glycine ligase [Myxococcales bacterium]|nr:phosphoribosylamine--glycine ligase [Myxococcales bacterium]MCB9519305.1 phosphoribosylamine--glycine ligase [Myxococcales bacterium]MCB9530749.1 phosphoribosylamine--glycine ligase [Myxococcales bacterium]MCB9533357.1 phosphoribosylamine--glycine ligase [Myxococcales bacterium]
MRALVVGAGGREHALAWKLASEPGVSRVFVAPGNPGTAADPRLENVALSGDALVDFAVREVDLVVVGPEAPLVAGLADRLRAHGVAVVGPGADGARLEASKAFCKEVLEAAGVPTAAYARVATHEEIDAFADAFRGDALVVKADGLAAGKGVIVCDSVAEARDAAHAMLRDRPFGEASDTLVLEERLIGVETSYIVLTDGKRFAALPTSQDHKRLRDGDEGPNTGGMGAYSPAPFVDDATAAEIEQRCIEPTLRELARRGIDYRGFLYAGVMLTAAGPKVLEYNVRLGDPETQALMMALGGGFAAALDQAARGELRTERFVGCRPAAVVVMAAEGYPEAPVSGATIDGVDAATADGRVHVFHAGTRTDASGALVAAGGRVLGVTAAGDSPEDALAAVYRGVSHIDWAGAQYRRDIGRQLRIDAHIE